ncbi:MAG: type II toxin-antitoxin system VapC family toxin [Acidobacteriota bacterium]
MTPTILDTDTLSRFHKRDPRVSIRASLETDQYGYLTFTEFTYYEITRGLKAKGATAQLARFEQFCLTNNILPFTHQASIIAADIWADLKQRGHLIGEIDILIAAIALSESLTVATHNTAHFSRVPNLTIVDWAV